MDLLSIYHSIKKWKGDKICYPFLVYLLLKILFKTYWWKQPPKPSEMQRPLFQNLRLELTLIQKKTQKRPCDSCVKIYTAILLRAVLLYCLYEQSLAHISHCINCFPDSKFSKYHPPPQTDFKRFNNSSWDSKTLKALERNLIFLK